MTKKETTLRSVPGVTSSFSLAIPWRKPDAEGTGEVKVNCMHCERDIMVILPRTHIEAQELVCSRRIEPAEETP